MKVHRLIGIILLLCCVSVARAQSINEVKEKQAKTEKEIAYLNKLLSEARKDKSATVQKLNIINRKITKGKEMLRSLESEMQYFDDLITGNEAIRRRLEADKQRMLDFYAKMVYETWKKRGSDNKLMYIFSASTFSQAYARYKYFEQIQDYSKKQLRRIQATNDSLRLINKQLKGFIAQRQQVQNEIVAQNGDLIREQNEANVYISDLKKREKELNRKLKAEIKNRENLAAQLKKLIAAQTKKSGSKTSTYKMTPQEQIVSTDFAKNKGKLPWPVAEGFISEHFGVNVHPVFKQVKLTNDGITITTAKNAAVRAVFGGVVTEIMFIPGYNNVVIIRHGSYLTVYSNLVEVFIKKGDSVRLKQSIGKLAESEKNSSVLNFQVWKDKDKLDPEQWIAPQ